MQLCRTDSIEYHDPQNVMTIEQEKADDAYKAKRLRSFFDQFVWGDKNQETSDTIDALLENEDVKAAIKKLVHNYIGIKETHAKEHYLYKALNKACLSHVDFCIKHHTDDWS